MLPWHRTTRYMYLPFFNEATLPSTLPKKMKRRKFLSPPRRRNFPFFRNLPIAAPKTEFQARSAKNRAWAYLFPLPATPTPHHLHGTHGYRTESYVPTQNRSVESRPLTVNVSIFISIECARSSSFHGNRKLPSNRYRPTAKDCGWWRLWCETVPGGPVVPFCLFLFPFRILSRVCQPMDRRGSLWGSRDRRRRDMIDRLWKCEYDKNAGGCSLKIARRFVLSRYFVLRISDRGLCGSTIMRIVDYWNGGSFSWNIDNDPFVFRDESNVLFPALHCLRVDWGCPCVRCTAF